MKVRTFAGRWLLWISCLLAAGCGGRDYAVAPVSGRVTLDGRPAAGIHVGFQPVGQGSDDMTPGPGSFAETDAEGRYQLETVEPTEPGAVVGRHRVRFAVVEETASPQDDVGRPPRVRLSPQYTDGSITFEVTAEGTDKADFDLKSR